jgi:hypothetical protein
MDRANPWGIARPPTGHGMKKNRRLLSKRESREVLRGNYRLGVAVLSFSLVMMGRLLILRKLALRRIVGARYFFA